jgi:hypothetical protein
MIVAGIDEAGYGPLLGPLVVGCAAFEVTGGAEPADPAGELPCLWRRLNKYVSRNRLKSGKKLHVNDSKLVYSPSQGLRELERSVLAMATTWQGWCDDLDALLARLAGHAVADLPEYAWYGPGEGERFPVEQDGLPIKLFANALAGHMKQAGVTCVHMAARVVFERQFNRMVNATRNKSDALFSTAAIHLDHLLRTYGSRGLVIVCDRQGGREHYGRLLRQMFEEWASRSTTRRRRHSEYPLTHAGQRGPHRLLREGGGRVHVGRAGLDDQQVPPRGDDAAINAYWKHHLPGVAPRPATTGTGCGSCRHRTRAARARHPRRRPDPLPVTRRANE